MMTRQTHSKKEVEDAVKFAETEGWTVLLGGGHAWGKMYCPYNDVECRCGEFCIVSIWSTPKNPWNHAKQLKRVVTNCTTHKKKRLEDENLRDVPSKEDQ